MTLDPALLAKIAALPVNVDATYPDHGPGDARKLHQQAHDTLHAFSQAAITELATKATTGSAASFASVYTGIDGITSDGTIFANNALFGRGYGLINGTTGRTGYLAFQPFPGDPGGRRGFIGFAENTGPLLYISENGGGHDFSGGTVRVQGTAPAAKVGITRGAAAQTASLDEWQDSAGSALVSVAASGQVQALKGAFFSNPAAGDTSFSSAAIEIRDATATNPRIGFHKPGVTAGQLVLEAGGQFAVRDNPGTGYTVFQAKEFQVPVNGLAASDAGGGTGGIVLRAPNGTRYRITVSNVGALVVTAA